jgi:hypothetical protein
MPEPQRQRMQHPGAERKRRHVADRPKRRVFAAAAKNARARPRTPTSTLRAAARGRSGAPRPPSAARAGPCARRRIVRPRVDGRHRQRRRAPPSPERKFPAWPRRMPRPTPAFRQSAAIPSRTATRRARSRRQHDEEALLDSPAAVRRRARTRAGSEQRKGQR